MYFLLSCVHVWYQRQASTVVGDELRDGLSALKSCPKHGRLRYLENSILGAAVTSLLGFCTYVDRRHMCILASTNAPSSTLEWYSTPRKKDLHSVLRYHGYRHHGWPTLVLVLQLEALIRRAAVVL